MTEQEMLDRMVAPGTHRPGKYGEQYSGFGGVIQILVTSTCDKACFNCTQASQLQRPRWFMTPEQFDGAVKSLGFTEDLMSFDGRVRPEGAYPGVVGLFGGNPALSPHFEAYCSILRERVPFRQRGIWCNNPVTLHNAKVMATTFDPSVSNLNVHMDARAYDLFREGWPEAKPFGLTADSRHSPPWVAMRDVVLQDQDDGLGVRPDDDRIRELISTCDINQHWSAMVGVFRGELRAWFCEVAGAQAMLHQDEPDYPDTGIFIKDGYLWTRPDPDGKRYPVFESRFWWKFSMEQFAEQVRKHCWDCGVPLRGYGELAQADRPLPAQGASYEPKEQVSVTHAAAYRPKRTGRRVEVVTGLEQLGLGKIKKATHYLQNASR